MERTVLSALINKSPTLKRFFGCRVCGKVALATFLAILIAEVIILIPSYVKFANEWRQSEAERALAATRGVITALGNEAPTAVELSPWLRKLPTMTPLLGWQLYSLDDKRVVDSFGQTDGMRAFVFTDTAAVVTRPTVHQRTFDVVWTEKLLQVPYRLQVRLEAKGLVPALVGLVVRIGGLIAVISLFATAVTMFVLSRWVLNPILNLRAHLQKAGETVDRPEQFVIRSERDDELGDVMVTFNEMLVRSGENLRTIRKKEEALQQAHDELELKVQERTAALRQEIYERRQIEERLREHQQFLFHSANYDELTGLPNRLLGLDRLGQALKAAERASRRGAMMFIDIDNFKEVNDTVGHARGDELLVELAHRLAGALRENDSVVHLSEKALGQKHAPEEETVARIGGDEFMVILPEIELEEDAALVADRLCFACSETFFLGGHEIFITVSIGITVFPRDGQEPRDLMIAADTALYAVKESGRNGYRFFSPEMNSKLKERLEIETRLRAAVEKPELEVYYQPVVNVRTQQFVAVEALLRWRNEELGWVSPDRFIPVAEATGLIIPIGEWVLHEACNAGQRLQALGFPLRIAVNVSTRQFRGANFIETVKNVLGRTGLPADRLELEITESLLVDEQSEAIDTISELRDLGVRFSIDDFGTGYSALGYLRRFRVNTLKIDRSFVSGVTTSKQDAALTRTMITMAQNMGLEIIAEGVEEKGQHSFLQRHGCDFAQGYYFGKPMPLAKLCERLQSRRAV